MRFLFAVVLLAAACGDSSRSFEDELEGSWIYERSDGCSVGMTFDGELYSYVVGCTLTDGSVGLEVTGGSYTAPSGNINLAPERSSCRDADRSPETLHATIRDGRLSVITAAGTAVFERNDAPPVSGQAPFGCYSSTGAFTPGPVQEF